MSGARSGGFEPRRQALRAHASLNGIDYVEVGEDHRNVTVFFFHPPPEVITAENFVISGGVRVRDPGIVSLRLIEPPDPDIERAIELVLQRPGDRSTYRLAVTGLPDFDPRYAFVDFTFWENQDEQLDCAAAGVPGAAVPIEPNIDYLAKDYAGFRRLALDRIAQTLPAWTERHVPDIGIVLVELMAYAGDHLSYYQDAVATEAYLETARLRTSIRRHARLIDYHMHEGCNARAWVHVNTPRDQVLAPDALLLAVGDTDPPAAIFAPVTTAPIALHAAHNLIDFHVWGDGDTWLPAGATSATLHDGWVGRRNGGRRRRRLDTLTVGTVLLIETARPEGDAWEDAAPGCHVVRLTSIDRQVDPLLDQPVVEAGWSLEDALPMAFRLRPSHLGTGRIQHARAPRGDFAVARGNMVLVDHGRPVKDEILRGHAPYGVHHNPAFRPGPRRPSLAVPNLTFRETPDPNAPASLAVLQEPGQAMPQVLSLTSRATAEDQADPETSEADQHAQTLHWTVQRDLIASLATDHHYVIEMQDDATAVLRFGDGDLGALPGPGSLRVTYRVGNGPEGNVGAETITRILQPDGLGLSVRNPLPATGGTPPEPIADVKLLAPHRFRERLERAITAEDYARIAGQVPGVRRAAADLVRRGAMVVARVAIVADAGEDADAQLIAQVAARLHRRRRIGHEVQVSAARYVPLYVDLRIGVLDDYLRGHVLADLRLALGTGVTPDGRLALFNPARMSFGEPVYGSRIIAAAQGVPGVDWIELLQLRRDDDTDDTPTDEIRLGGFEIAQLDNDISHPERGRLLLRLEGGR